MIADHMNRTMQKTFLFLLLLLVGCNPSGITGKSLSATQLLSVPHEQRWGLYQLDLADQHIQLIYSSANEISFLHLSNRGDRFVFTQKVGDEATPREQIFTLNADGSDLQQLTGDPYRNLYPVWSPDDTLIAFLSQHSNTLGVFVMNSDGSQINELYDSEVHDADIDWVGDWIAFTRDSQIWIMQSDGSDAKALTNPTRVGEWGGANLPFGDYDPRISPDGKKIVFERLLDDQSSNGNYDLFVIDRQTGEETRLTSTGYSQGLPSWSHSGQQLVYTVAAIDEDGKYDLYVMNADGSSNHNVTPEYFPSEFLCNWAIFSRDDESIFFVGEWWQNE
jgi:Tol biopolymer transport system component